MARTSMRPGWWVSLLCAVWCVYTFDHLMDARRAGPEPTTARHAFHRRHARALSVALVGVAMVGLAAAWTLRPPVRLFGLGLGLAVLVYLASAQSLILADLPKEPIAGILYAAGIWGGPIIMGDRPAPWLIVAAALHALAAVLNLVMIGVFEVEADRFQGHRSIALRAGTDRTRAFVLIAGAVGASAAAAFALGAPSFTGFAVLALQVVTPAVLLLAHRWAVRRERYRTWGDAVFLLGALPRLSG
jgi:4-hydroxybenzoate polyprenyltransferase